MRLSLIENLKILLINASNGLDIFLEYKGFLLLNIDGKGIYIQKQPDDIWSSLRNWPLRGGGILNRQSKFQMAFWKSLTCCQRGYISHVSSYFNSFNIISANNIEIRETLLKEDIHKM